MVKQRAVSDLEQEMLDYHAKSLQNDIDFEIITELLVETGWVRVVLKPMTMETGDAIDLWLLKNCKGKYKTRGLVWVFEDPKDAMWFTLRWLESDHS